MTKDRPHIEPATALHRFRCALQWARPEQPSVMIPQGDARLLLQLVSVADDLNRAGGDDVDYWLEELNKVMHEMTAEQKP